MNCDRVPSSRSKSDRTERHHGQRAGHGIDSKRSHRVRAIINRIKTLVSRVDRQLLDRTTLNSIPSAADWKSAQRSKRAGCFINTKAINLVAASILLIEGVEKASGRGRRGHSSSK